MIFDRIENLERYAGTIPGAREIAAFISRATTDGPKPGRYELDGRDLFIGISEYHPKTFDPGRIEYHRKYIDIQLVFSGSESIYYAPIGGLEEVKAYSEESDYGLCRVPGEAAAVKLGLEPGNFAVFFPEEGHLPGVGDPATTAVKAVVKIAVK